MTTVSSLEASWSSIQLLQYLLESMSELQQKARSIVKTIVKIATLLAPIYPVLRVATPYIYEVDAQAMAMGLPDHLHYDIYYPLNARIKRAAVRNKHKHFTRPGSGSEWHLDEYPYASTAENTGDNAHAGYVPRHENLFQGGTLGAFYVPHAELIVEVGFWVVLV